MIPTILHFYEKFKIQIWLIIGALTFGLAGDLIYGGAELADTFLVGMVLASLSTFFMTVVIFVTIWQLVVKHLFKWMTDAMCCHVPIYPEEETKKGKKKK